MEWFNYFLCILLGAVLLLSIQGILIAWYIWNIPTGSPIPSGKPPEFHLPKSVEHIGLYSDNGDCAAAVSLTLQFLFQELKHAPAPLSWLHRKLHQEMVDLLTRTTSGKLFEFLTIRSISTGDSAPCIRWAGVQNVEMYKEGRIKTLDLLLDVYYSGGFRLAVDAGILLGKTACIDIEVEQLSGRARIRFTTQPFTHWSLSFLSPPQLELCARPLKGRLAALLQAHARRVLQKRHTLPNYSIRFKPFFTKTDPAQFDMLIEDALYKLEGNLEITIFEITRLFTDSWECKDNKQIFCTISLDSNSWIACRHEKNCYIFTLDIVITKDKTQQLGTVFKQTVNENNEKSPKTQVIIETVVPLSAAYRADLRRDDVIIAVDNKLISSMSQIAKIIKNVNRPCFTIRIERMKTIDNYDNYLKNNKHDLSQVDPFITKPEKCNPFSFRKMSDIIDSAKSVGQEGRTLLRNAHSNWNIQDMDKKTDNELDMKNNIISTTKSLSKPNDSLPYTKATSNSTSSSKPLENLQTFSFGLRKRRCSVENKTSSDSSNSSTPTASSPGTPSKRSEKLVNRDKKRLSLEDNLGCHVKLERPESILTPKICVNKLQQENVDDDYSIKDCNLESNTNLDNSSNKGKTAFYEEKSGLFQTQTSDLIPLSDVLICQEIMIFKLNQNHRYININVWGKNPNGEHDVLLAYLNIPLLTILNDCFNSKISQLKRKFTLLPPEVNLSVSKSHPLSSHHGFEPCLCYGDILLCFSWLNQTPQTSQPKTSNITQNYKHSQELEKDSTDEINVCNTINQSSDTLKSNCLDEEITQKVHNFLRTHFHRSTQCDYCGKKIWLKDAMQCRDCAMCCHKKCVTKCLSSGSCQPLSGQGDELYSQYSSTSQKPQFVMTDHCDDIDDVNPNESSTDDNLLGRNTFTGLLGGLRRVGSAHSLSPTSHCVSPVKSLPPSPHHTPRCQSPDDDIAWTAFESSLEKGIKNTEDLLKPLIAAQIPSDVLLAKAKDSGPRLLAHLPSEIRTERITTLIADIKVALDNESKKLIELQNSKEKRSMKRLDEIEEKCQILTALLLHCCSAMQSTSIESV